MTPRRNLAKLVLLSIGFVASKAGAVETSRLASLDRPGVMEAAVDELTGKNNGLRTLPGKTAATIVVALTATDEQYLVHDVFGPYLWDVEKRRILERAACQRDLRRSHVDWTKTMDEALAEGACEVHLEARDLFVNPAVKLALADQLLLGHPRRDILLNAARLAISETVGATVHRVCYGAHPTEAAALDDPTCDLDWSDPAPSEAPRVAAFYFDPRPLDQWSLEDIVDAWTPLTGMKSKEGQARVEQLRAAFKARVEKRDATIAERRRLAPASVSAADATTAPGKDAVYLWHSTCGELKGELVPTDTGTSEIESICVKVAYLRPSKGGCVEDRYELTRTAGTTAFKRNGPAMASDPIECP